MLITGGFGFIGSNIVKKLLSHNKYKVIVIDKLTYSTIYNINFFKKNKNLKYYKQDIKNQKKISQILQSERPNIIINLAAESHVDNSIKRKKRFLETNIIGVDSFLDACKNQMISWGDFLKPSRKGLTHSEWIGYWGELYVLLFMIHPNYSFHEAVKFWIGPLMKKQDF